MSRVGNWIRDRHLMRAPEALEPLAIKLFWTRPTFRRLHHDHRPSRTNRIRRIAFACLLLNRANFQNATFERTGHQLMHRGRLVALYYIRLIAIALKQTFQFFGRNARKDRRVRNLIAIQMENGQHGTRHRVSGSGTLLECHDDGEQAVSDSPSPTTATAINSGLSKAAPYAAYATGE